MRAFDLATSTPYACEPNALRQLLAVASREVADTDLASLLRLAHAQREAVATALGRPLDGTRSVTVRDGVAILPITGMVMRYANVFSEISGGASIQLLAKDFKTALDDPAVHAVLLHIDSPGGEVTGVHSFADQVFAARGVKPVEVYAEGLCASAAYWIASAAERITIEATADVGSIGVVMAIPDPGTRAAKDITFVSSQSPNKRLDPTSESGRNRLQTLVDDTADVFIGAVARNRGMTADQVVADFDAGGMLTGAKAQAAGLVDAVGSFESTLAALAERSAPRSLFGSSRRAAVPALGIDRLTTAIRRGFNEH